MDNGAHNDDRENVGTLTGNDCPTGIFDVGNAYTAYNFDLHMAFSSGR
jgi:hypothetical protein